MKLANFALTNRYLAITDIYIIGTSKNGTADLGLFDCLIFPDHVAALFANKIQVSKFISVRFYLETIILRLKLLQQANNYGIIQ